MASPPHWHLIHTRYVLYASTVLTDVSLALFQALAAATGDKINLQRGYTEKIASMIQNQETDATHLMAASQNATDTHGDLSQQLARHSHVIVFKMAQHLDSIRPRL